MDWTRQIDAYCERLGPGLWAEPVNAVTNLAFVAVALALWPRTVGIERVLCALLLTIGIGSGLFHTFATPWAGVADTLPIAFFALSYIYAANRRYLGWSVPLSLAGTLAYLPYGWAMSAVFAQLPGFAISAIYWPLPLLIALYGLFLLRRLPSVGRGLIPGAALLSLSLTFRSLDMPLCTGWPIGTHFLWHILNALMLGWMIRVLIRHRLEYGTTGG
ncbi:hypothetical protein [Palleronia caenipelagi]|uniref:Ceramidase n=1 Tax=Palleronia caenipelagi TaxID=2489174 RepID=A0A547Q753_9RHOB|nr:hypothetical protein [Palleronia caenipelagi]TRD22217.1 hypothetical protein FEV53_05710 [Palleronia caenipelagi]